MFAIESCRRLTSNRNGRFDKGFDKGSAGGIERGSIGAQQGLIGLDWRFDEVRSPVETHYRPSRSPTEMQ